MKARVLRASLTLHVGAALAAALASFCATAQAETGPLWELGLGAGVVRVPHYRGAGQSGTLLLPLPYLVYRGPILKADRDGARALLLAHGAWELNLSAWLNPPVDSADNRARRGMPHLPATAEVGPNLKLRLLGDRASTARLTLQLPVRAVVAVQRRPRIEGWQAAPHVQWESRQLLTRWNFAVQTGPVWADRSLNQWIYGVDSAYAEPDRPAFAARGGYAGWTSIATLTRRFDRWWVGAYLRSDLMQGAVFADSPLLERRHTLAGGIGIARVIAQSARQVAD
jgi:outer membrane scaffolding protein for murein synthesis (MipA/OmpV family)